MTLSHCAKPRWKSPHWKPPHLWLLYHMSIKTGCLDFSKWLLKCCSNKGLHVHHRKAFQPAAHQWEDSGEQTGNHLIRDLTEEECSPPRSSGLWLHHSSENMGAIKGGFGLVFLSSPSLSLTHTAQTGHGLPAVGNSFYYMCESDKCLCGLGVTAR